MQFSYIARKIADLHEQGVYINHKSLRKYEPELYSELYTPSGGTKDSALSLTKLKSAASKLLSEDGKEEKSRTVLLTKEPVKVKRNLKYPIPERIDIQEVKVLLDQTRDSRLQQKELFLYLAVLEKMEGEEVNELITRIKRHLINTNLSLMFNIRIALDIKSEDFPTDLAFMALNKAIDTYDPLRESGFANYASKIIKRELTRKTKKEPWLVYMAELPEQRFPTKYDNPKKNILESLVHGEECSEIPRLIYEMVKVLSERELDILKRVYGLNGTSAQGYKEIGKTLSSRKISRERVKQIQNRALNKIRSSKHCKALENYLKNN